DRAVGEDVHGAAGVERVRLVVVVAVDDRVARTGRRVGVGAGVDRHAVEAVVRIGIAPAAVILVGVDLLALDETQGPAGVLAQQDGVGRSVGDAGHGVGVQNRVADERQPGSFEVRTHGAEALHLGGAGG